MSRTRLLPAAFAVLALGLAGVLGAALPAAAHSTIVDSSPADGAELTEAPAVFSVTANEDLADVTGTGEGFALRVVFLPADEIVASGPLTIDGPTVSMPGVPLDPGVYAMQYQLVSADGHPVSGEITFTILDDGGGGGAGTPDTGTDVPSVDPMPEKDIVPISATLPGPPGWLAGAIAVALIAVGAIAAAASRRR